MDKNCEDEFYVKAFLRAVALIGFRKYCNRLERNRLVCHVAQAVESKRDACTAVRLITT